MISSSVIDACSGFVAGLITTILAHPLDLIKVRLQLNQSNLSSWKLSRQIFHDILYDNCTNRDTLPLRISRLYRGLTPNIIGNSLSWGLYFSSYGLFKDFMSHRLSDRGKSLKSTDFFLASGLAGLFTAILTNPIWVLKTHILATQRNSPGSYRTFYHGFSTIWQQEGFGGFFHGLTPSLLTVGYGALQFVIYEELKRWRIASSLSHLGSSDFLLASALAKISAGCITYPLQVIRSRMQYASFSQNLRLSGLTCDFDANHTESITRIVKHIWKTERIKGFYRGLCPNIARVLPSTCVTFVVFENMRLILQNMYMEQS